MVDLRFRANVSMEQKFPRRVERVHSGERTMQAAVDRVMKTYGMIVNLTVDEERAARQKVTLYLAEKPETDEKSLAIEGLRYLRSVREKGVKD
jgi:hypothetical protein